MHVGFRIFRRGKRKKKGKFIVSYMGLDINPMHVLLYDEPVFCDKNRFEFFDPPTVLIHKIAAICFLSLLITYKIWWISFARKIIFHLRSSPKLNSFSLSFSTLLFIYFPASLSAKKKGYIFLKNRIKYKTCWFKCFSPLGASFFFFFSVWFSASLRGRGEKQEMKLTSKLLLTRGNVIFFYFKTPGTGEKKTLNLISKWNSLSECIRIDVFANEVCRSGPSINTWEAEKISQKKRRKVRMRNKIK